MAKGSSLGLTLPAQTKPVKESFDIRSGALAKWLSALPAGNIGETTKQLYRALHEVNRHSHPWKRRFRFMETIREPLHGAQRAIGTRYAGVSYPLPVKTQQIAVLSQRLHTEVAIGYIAAIEEMLDSLFLFHSRHHLKVMIHRAVCHLNQSLLTAYQVYGQQQPGTWQQLHALYAFAETMNVHQDPIKDPLWGEQGESSIARIYKQIVLLATTSPYRLRQGEAVATHQALARWAAHAKLLGANDSDATDALFTLHLDSDDEPEYRSLDHRSCDGTACRYVDTRQLVHIVQEEAGYAGSVPGSLLTPDLYKRLIQGWKLPPARSERRNQGGDCIEVVIGMIQIHQLLAPPQEAQTAAPKPSQFTSTPTLAISTPIAVQHKGSDDIWNIYSAKEKKPPVNAPTPQQEPVRTLAIRSWQVINESVGGFRLGVPEGQEATVRVGEILAVREEHSHERWHLTEVRWIRQYDQGTCEAGVRIIASDMVPVMVKNLTAGKNKGEFQRGLLLPEVAERGQPATVFTPNRLFCPSEKVLLHVSGQQIEIVLGNVIQESGSFVQFEFHADEKSNMPPADPPAVKGGSPFEKLWAQL